MARIWLPPAQEKDAQAEAVREAAELVTENAYAHLTTWAGYPEAYWLARLLEEVSELALALTGNHAHEPDIELVQVAGIALQWLARRRRSYNAR